MSDAPRRGRPREFDETVSVRLPKDLHDALSREALRRSEKLSDVMRQRLAGNFVSQKDRDG